MKKKKFLVTGMITISVHTEVEAHLAEEAEQIIRDEDRPMMTLCHSCASASADGQWATSGERDGSVEDELTVTEL